jgi:hypothetical protein
MTLTLTVLLALFTAIAIRPTCSPAGCRRRSRSWPRARRPSPPATSRPRQAIYSRDELGVLTQSFNRMTRQLDDARRDTERHRAEVESARAYLESILANLSAGVLVFDRRFCCAR